MRTRKDRTGGSGRTVDEYLARLDDTRRGVLERMRQQIRAAAPGAEECINFGVCAFRLDGQMLIGFGAAASHCALYLFSGSTIAAHKDQLAGYKTSKGAIRFPADRPLPATLVRRLVRARIAENRR